MGATAIAILSILVLVGCAGIAISLTRVTRVKWMWPLMAAALLLLAVVRALGLRDPSQGANTEIVHLVAAVLLLLTLAGIRPLYRSFHSSLDKLSDYRRERDQVAARLRLIEDHARIVVFSIDASGIFTRSEGLALEWLGLKPGEAVGRSVYEMYQDKPEIIATVRRALGGEEVSAVLDVVDRAFEIHRTPVKDSRGNVVAVDGAASDVTTYRRSERKLSHTKERFRTLVEATSDWMWEVDIDCRYTYASPKVTDLLGYLPDEVIGKTLWDLIPPGEDEAARETFERFARSGVAFANIVTQRLAKNGRRVVLESGGVPVRDSAGNFIGYRGIDRDVTEREQAQEALRESERRLQLALGAARMGTWDWDIASNNVRWSGEAETLLRLMPGTFRGTSEDFVNLVHPDDRDPVRRAVERIRSEKTRELRHRFRVVTPSGEVHWLEAIGQTILDQAGKPARLIGVAMDVTESVVAERLLRREKDTAQTYLDVAGTMMVAIDKDRKVRLINRKGCETLGYTEAEIVGKDWFESAIPANLRAEVSRVFDRIIRGELEPIEYYENPVRTKSGEERVIAWHNAVIRDEEGAILATLSSGTDITERQRAERVKEELEDQLRHAQRMETVGTLAGGIAHDFNNILAPILGYTDLALEELGRGNPVSEYLEHVITASRRAKELVEQLLVFSRQVESVREPIQLHLVIREALKLVRASLPNTIEIQQDIDAATGTVLANRAQIDQVLINLCTNSAHAMRDTGGVLRVTLDRVNISDQEALQYEKLRPGPHARLVVADTGHGMDRATMGRIFEPFFTTKEVGEGTGLGLPVVHGIVAGHKGAITVDSTVGKGTTMTVYLPITANEARVEEPIADVDVHGEERVLFVDDEPEIAIMGKRMLKRLGYRVTVAKDGEQALAEVRAHPEDYDVMVVDQVMPPITGLALAEEVLRIRRDLPIILITGHSDRVPAAKLKELGICELLVKPIVARTLGAAIRKALRAKATRDNE